MRTLWIALLLLGCGKSKAPTPQTNGSGSAVTPSMSDAARPAIEDDEPKTAPPPPTTRSGSKGDCKTEYAPKPKRDPNPMCKVDGGTLEMVDGTDKMTVKLSPYYIDQFEVTNAQVAHYLNATDGGNCPGCFDIIRSNAAGPWFIEKRNDGTYGVLNGFENVAYDYATQQGAANYCAWAGKLLPTEPQWEFAARHDPKTGKDSQYPWGDSFDGKRARCAQEYCPEAPGIGSDDINQSRPIAVGMYSAGQSPWGLFDMAGNADEHVADCLYAYGPCDGGVCVDPSPHGPERGKCETVTRGGHNQSPRQLASTYRSQKAPGMRAGIRCARPAK